MEKYYKEEEKIKTYSFNLCRWAVKNAISLPKCFAGSKPMAATYGIRGLLPFTFESTIHQCKFGKMFHFIPLQ
jgi:hypothetical protein